MREMGMTEVMKVIKAKASMRMPLHSRIMQLLKVRKTGTHSDFFQQLERMMQVWEWESMMVDKFLIHIFSEQSDATMSRVAMEISAGPNLSVATLCTKICKP